MITWDNLQRSEFFQWFGLTETGRNPRASGFIVHCKPGGYQESTDLAFWVDGTQLICEAELVMNRGWMEDIPTAPFAADIAKSFLLTVGANDPAMLAFGQQIEHFTLQLPRVISRATDKSALPPRVPDESSPALEVYRGAQSHGHMAGKLSTLTIDNVGSRDDAGAMAERCRLRWTAA